MTTDLDAPLGAAGTLVLDELMSIEWRHHPEPRRAARLLVADLPTGRLELSCNAAVDEVVATLDGQQVGRVHDGAMLPEPFMWEGCPGPKLELGDRTGTLTWRMHGSKLRPLGRTRAIEIELGDRSYCFWKDAFHLPLSRQRTPGGERVVVVGTSGTTLASSGGRDIDLANLDSTRHSLNWLAQTTTAELVLAELMTMGMPTINLWSLPGKLLNRAANGSRSNV